MADSTVQRQNPESIFAERGLEATIETHVREAQDLYRSDRIPWVVGYSGGKDSTAVLQLVWLALRGLPPAERRKPVHVISTDTLVENPVVAAWVGRSLASMERAAAEQGLPIQAHRLAPAVADSFWVNLIGRGYPAPRPKFRWCTERLKIKPSNRFILDVVRKNGEAILVLGTRKAESARRAKRMQILEEQRARDRLSPNASLPNSLVYTPIEQWSNDDVWLFLMQQPNAWGHRNKDLLSMYQGASADGECPLVVDTTTQSCGDSRFGCWVCTLVDKDRSMSAMIQNDEEKEWMQPLLALRDELDLADDRHLRDFRRISGRVQLYKDRAIHGPYTEPVRHHWLRRLLEAQRWIREHGPDDVRAIELISRAELAAIRRIWVFDKHEIEDELPRIYEDVLREPFDGPELYDRHVFGRDEMKVLAEVCDGDELHFQLLRELLEVERRFRTAARRSSLFREIEQAFRRSAFNDIEEATARARVRRDALAAARDADDAGVEAVFAMELEDFHGTPTSEACGEEVGK